MEAAKLINILLPGTWDPFHLNHSVPKCATALAQPR
jgi:hypothetical protein